LSILYIPKVTDYLALLCKALGVTAPRFALTTLKTLFFAG